MEVVGMRDRLIHGYDVVDLNIVWQTVHENIVPTRSLIVSVLHQERIEAGEIPPTEPDT